MRAAIELAIDLSVKRHDRAIQPARHFEDVALVTPQKSATFRDIRDIWGTPFFRPLKKSPWSSQARQPHRSPRPQRWTCPFTSSPALHFARHPP
jgi:hypothetical protein